jgi:p-cumate 2,3-dioxygenase beta subunit
VNDTKQLGSPALHGWALRLSVEDLLILEATLLDEWRLSDWIDLLTLDCVYEMPATDLPGGDPAATFSLIHEHREMIEQRVLRLNKMSAHAERPRSRTRRLVTNVRILGESKNEVRAQANFTVHRLRADTQIVYVGHYEYTLRHTHPGMKIAHRKVILDHSTLDAHGKVSIIL